MDKRRKSFRRSREFIKNKRAGGIDKFKYFPHKKAIPRLEKQLTKRFFKYKSQGLYDFFSKNKLRNNRISN